MLLAVVLGVVSVIALAILVIVVLIASRPAAFRIARSETISASAAAIFPHVNDLHAWEAWSPFEKLDPCLNAPMKGQLPVSVRRTRGPATARREKVEAPSRRAVRTTWFDSNSNSRDHSLPPTPWSSPSNLKKLKRW